MDKVLKGKPVAEKLYEESRIIAEKYKGVPKLLSVMIGGDEASKQYVRSKSKKLSALGFEFELLELPDEITENEAQEKIGDAIESLNPDGIMIERPVPKHMDFWQLAELIPPISDIDCQRYDSLGRLMAGNPIFVPATAGAVVELLRFYGIKTAGKRITLIGRSLTVGLPLSVMLLWKNDYGNATLTVCHSRTKELQNSLKNAEIIISAAGKAGLIKQEMVSDGVIVIDVGINFVNGKLVGDVDFEGVSMKAAAITPVPGGVGAVTTAYLIKNLAKAFELRKKLA